MTSRLSEIASLPTLDMAKELLGMKLSTLRLGAITSGIIVEVEAYLSNLDEASHSYKGQTARNVSMFKEAGHCYVYQIYGMHYCFNVVTEPHGIGEAVLIRALEPLEGVEAMQSRRKSNNIRNLLSGPGKLCQALAIDRSSDGLNLLESNDVFIENHRSFEPGEISNSPRIGISKAINFPWRFYVNNSPWISRG